ncbi:hypothetical protein Q5P01_021532 [Channa striata]|uniref:Uncharacterized protein n=1 Tax=Channa striata TaxID=64152 RepID=A0AA88LUD4_CHASR|nr:hypothetical protein Q5P01_021532 [Channa striata]
MVATAGSEREREREERRKHELRRRTIRGFAARVRAPNHCLKRGQQGTLREEYMKGGEGEVTTVAVPPRSKFTQTCSVIDED